MIGNQEKGRLVSVMSGLECKIIGPFLGPRGKNGVEIFIALPEHQATKLTCKIFENSHEVHSCNSQVDEDDIYKLFSFKFEELEENKTYNYEFLLNRETLPLENGLNKTHCNFRVLGESNEDKSFILMSCHNPFQEEKGSADDGWAVWKQLSDHLQKDKGVRLLVLGGDQIYNDDIEKEYIKKLGKLDSSIEKKLKKRFIKQYQRYWGHLSYRKVLASTLSIAMWDDHDITDGWGSRPGSFSSKENTGFKKNWWKFFEVANEIFKYYQSSRNPTPVHKFSTVLDWGNERFILADFRSERNSKKHQLWTEEHKNKVLEKLKSVPENIKSIFFVSPVVAFRTNFSGDKRLKRTSKVLFNYRKWFKKSKFLKWIILLLSLILFFNVYFLDYNIFCRIISQIMGIIFGIFWILPFIPELPDLSDDMEDGLSSDSNMESLKEIMDTLSELARTGKEVYILSGDIHVGGLTEIIDTRETPKIQILQIVSSPIAYKPMPKVVAGFTTTTSEMVVRDCANDKRLFARNIFYLSKRNFVQIFPNKKESSINFHFENHSFPISFPKKFIRL